MKLATTILGALVAVVTAVSAARLRNSRARGDALREQLAEQKLRNIQLEAALERIQAKHFDQQI